MSLLFDSFWRAMAYCFRPRVIALSLLPLVLSAALCLGLGYLYWATAVSAVTAWLQASSFLGAVSGWLQNMGWGSNMAFLAPLLLIFTVTPAVVVLSLLLVALLMTPALTALVAERRFPALVRKNGGSLVAGLIWSLLSTLLALVALVVSVPLWLIPPLILVLPPLIWGWLTYRVMAFDALAAHASQEERQEIFRRHRMALLGIGVFCGYLGAAPSVIWASGVVFAAAFVVLVPLGVWLYTLVFALSSLWFAHYCLAALDALRKERLLRPDRRAPAETTNPASNTPAADTLLLPETHEIKTILLST